MRFQRTEKPKNMSIKIYHMNNVGYEMDVVNNILDFLEILSNSSSVLSKMGIKATMDDHAILNRFCILSKQLKLFGPNTRFDCTSRFQSSSRPYTNSYADLLEFKLNDKDSKFYFEAEIDSVGDISRRRYYAIPSKFIRVKILDPRSFENIETEFSNLYLYILKRKTKIFEIEFDPRAKKHFDFLLSL